MAVKLDGIVPWGRSFDEYVRMFALSQADLGRTILDCAAGPASFTAEMHRRGGCALAADPVYAFSAEDIRGRVEAVRELLRVAEEVRIFPITDMAGQPSPHLNAVCREFRSQRVPVEYEFLRGANRMLVLRG